MTLRVPRRLAASLALLCVLAGCKHAQERSVPLSEVVKASQASRGTRIQTAAVATYSDPEWRVLFVQEDSAQLGRGQSIGQCGGQYDDRPEQAAKHGRNRSVGEH